MNDFNSRYKNIDDQPGTIKTNAGTFEYGGFSNDMDIMEAENAQKKKQVARASQARGGSARRRKSRRTMIIYGIIIAIEVVILAVIWTMYFTYNKSDSSSSEASESSSEESSSSDGNINVDNDNFALTCTKISITTDATGNPAGVIYFTFVNKTESPLSMAQVFAPGFKQAGSDLATNGILAEEPAEIGNKDIPVANGESIVCGYVVPLVDTTSEITITMHDNYETFSDIGSTVVAIN